MFNECYKYWAFYNLYLPLVSSYMSVIRFLQEVIQGVSILSLGWTFYIMTLHHFIHSTQGNKGSPCPTPAGKGGLSLDGVEDNSLLTDGKLYTTLSFVLYIHRSMEGGEP